VADNKWEGKSEFSEGEEREEIKEKAVHVGKVKGALE
jgi:hypothetical protein